MAQHGVRSCLGETLGKRTKNRGNKPDSYDDEGLRKEIVRVHLQLQTLPHLSSSLRKLRTSRLHNLEKELARRMAD